MRGHGKLNPVRYFILVILLINFCDYLVRYVLIHSVSAARIIRKY